MIEMVLKAAKHPVMIEAYFTGQMARHIRTETGFDIQDKLLKYDGPLKYNISELANFIKYQMWSVQLLFLASDIYQYLMTLNDVSFHKF